MSDRETHVCLLRKALYGLKQAPRAWYSRIDTYLLQMGFEKSDADPNLYFIIRGEDTLILILYVDDLFITGVEDLIVECKMGLVSKFEMSDIGLMHYFLGMEVWQEEGHIFLGQGKYAVDILSRFQMEDCRPMSTPMITNWKKLSASDSQLVDATVYRQLIGSLMYLVNTRPDICFAVNTLSQYMVRAYFRVSFTRLWETVIFNSLLFSNSWTLRAHMLVIFTYYWSSQDHDAHDPFSGNMQALS